MVKNKRIELYKDEIGAVEYVAHMGSDLTIVNAARVSFGKNKNFLDDKDKKLIKYLIKHKHTSTLEHNVVTFKFTVPLIVRSQHHRHRTWSYNEISRRYTDKDLQFYIPHQFRTQHKSNRQASNEDELIDPVVVHDWYDSEDGVRASQIMNNLVENSIKIYKSLLNAGICREQARMVLPQNLYTEYYGTVNLNNLLKFIELRLHEGAQWEIQKIASACLQMASELWPVAISHYKDIRNLDWEV